MDKPHYLYVICESETAPVKIGFSADPNKRLRQLQTGHPAPLTLYHKEEVRKDQVRGLEKAIHKELSHRRKQGEWFSLSPEEAVSEIRHALIRYGDVENLSMKLRAGTA